MIKHFLLISLRLILRDKVYSLISIIGLTIGLTVGLLLGGYILFVNSIDTFHPNNDNKYWVNLEPFRPVYTENANQVLNFTKEYWEIADPDASFSYSFVDSDFAQFYEKDRKLSESVLLISLLCIVIAAIGLYGLISFTLDQRQKEIGIRKILGASIQNIIIKINGNIFILLVVSFIISIPITYYLMKRWLENFTSHIQIDFIPYIISFIIVLLVILIAVLSQTIKKSLVSPIRVLGDE